MRHASKTKKFGRKKKQRGALMRSLAESLFKEGRVRTTEAKAKFMRPFVERIITLSKDNSLGSRRLIRARLKNPLSLSKLYKEIAPKYASRNGGYTRIVKTGFRLSDGAKMAVIELV